MMYIITLQWQTGFEWQTGPGISSAPSPPNAPCRLGVFTQNNFFSVRPSTQRSRLGGPRRSFPETFNSQRKLLNCQVSSSIFFYPGKACVLSGWHMMEGGAYGASFAGGAFDFQSFLKLPQTILRVLSWVSHTEALACRTSQLSHQEFSWTHVCRYRPNKPCNSG